jgi:hypothetical protein
MHYSLIQKEAPVNQIPTESSNRRESFWKNCTLFLAGCLISLLTAYFSNQKNVVTKDDLRLYLEPIQVQVNSQGADLTDVKASVKQLESDTSRIAGQLGVPAHPAILSH